MKKFTIPLFLILLSSCSNTSKSYQPRFFSNNFVGLIVDKVVDYQSVQLDYDLTSPDEKNVNFSSCQQVDSIQDQDILASEYHLLTMLRLNCKALKMYTTAGEAKTSYLGQLLDEKAIRNLPATAYPYVNNEDKAKRLNKTLSEYHTYLESELLLNGATRIETDVDTVIYQAIATGDFNNDSIEDVLIRIDWSVKNAFDKGSKLILLTKKSTDEGFSELAI